MSLGSYFFGNVDDNGKLDSDLPEEIRESLANVSDESFAKLFGNPFGVDSMETGEGSKEDESDLARTQRAEALAKAEVRPVASAVDFSDFNEIAEDSLQSKKYMEQGMRSIKGEVAKVGKSISKRGYDDDYDEDEEEEKAQAEEPSEASSPILKAHKIITEPQRVLSLEDIIKAYPAFEPNSVLKFSELFANPHYKKFRTEPSKNKKPCAPLQFSSDGFQDQKSIFESQKIIPRPSSNLLDEIVEICRKAQAESQELDYESEKEEVDDEILSKAVCPDIYQPIAMDPWDEEIIWEVNEDDSSNENENLMSRDITFFNHDLANGTWESSILWDENQAEKAHYPVLLDLNDTNMLFELASTENKSSQSKADDSRGMRLLKRAKKLGFKGIPILENKDAIREQMDKFNLSNDLYYETLLTGKVRVRQTFGQITVQHAAVALRLQQPFFKTKLTKPDLRRWHRPPAHFPIGVVIQFNKARTVKKKKLKPKPNEEIMQTPKEVSLKDDHPFVLVEYSEEYPPIIQNIGMGSILINYYRKRDNDDDYIHDPPIGEPITLDVTDVSPFMNFGNVEPGDFMLCFYNNLYKTPVFHHKPKPNDFLLVRHCLGGKSKYYIREITDLYVAGQTYPLQEVPGPHSRKITATIKNRLQVASYRLIKKSAKQHLKIQSLAKLFPEYNEGQIRTKLKEFAEFQRTGASVGFWKLKSNNPLPDEEELRKLATPEMICLYESMLVGQRHLQDAGYGKSAEEDDNTDENESKLTIEEQLAPWIITRNFINATQGKAMLKLYGEGDPTGRGEGFSFVRVSMKDIFLRAGESAEEKLAEIEARPKSAHRYNVAEQQMIYREEITRIWNTQNQSLANEEDVVLTDVDSDEDLDLNSQRQVALKRESSMDLRTAKSSRQVSPSPSLPSAQDHISVTDPNGRDDEMSVGGSINSGASNANPKILVIRRLIKHQDREEWVTETIRNPAVIRAYTRRRDAIKDPNSSEPPSLTQLRQKTQDQLSRVQRSREKRIAKLKAQEAKEGGTIPSHLAPKGKKELVRRCGNCGELGHMKTNRKCPKYVEGKT